MSYVLSAIAVSGAVIHLAQAHYFFASAWEFKSFHLGFALVLIYLSRARSTKIPMVTLALLASAATVYVLWQYDSLISTRVFTPSNSDIFITIVLVLLTLTATKLQWGWTLPALAVGAVLYAYFGAYVPGELFFHSGIELTRLTSYLAIPSFQGVLGSLTGLSATMVFVFMIYVGMLNATGGTKFIISIGTALAGKSRSSPALISIFGSAFMGMLSGSTVANVASTGTMTIPLMKRAGYRAEDAGAIEAVASLGGQFTPPIMGLTAFLIVGIAGIPYSTIIAAAVTPALIYYAYLAFSVHFRAKASAREPVSPDQELDVLSGAQAMREYGHLVVSLVALVYFLAVQAPPATAATRAIVIIALAELLKGWWRKDIHGSGRTVLEGLERGALLGAQLAIILATIGILTDIVVITGFAQKLSFLILSLGGGTLWAPLLLSALACLTFGLGLPTPAAYVLVALFSVPALIDAGIPRLHAHLFVFYFANMSAITPPVALAPLVASKIADAGYFKTAGTALQLGLPGFVLPFLFALFPALLIQGGVGFSPLWLSTLALAGIVLVSAAMTGAFYWPLSRTERALFAVISVTFLSMDWRLVAFGSIGFAVVAARRVARLGAVRNVETTGL